MELIERAEFLTTLQTKCKDVAEGEGHCMLVCGESGIGKTSLIKALCKEVKDDYRILQGSCDALFTPRPLAPLYDIIWQLGSDLREKSGSMTNRAELFNRFFYELADQQQPTLIIFEDIHWADEATLDFIKFLARRITRIHCLFILTYRDNEIHSLHPLRNVLGQLPPDSFSRMQLAPLSRRAVEKWAVEKGYSGEDVYSISGGNPFYVNEILASYSQGIPDNIKDSVLSVYNQHDDKTKHVWQILSVLPTGFETRYLHKMDPTYLAAVENCVTSKILIVQDGLMFFKHELYRRTVEASLSPLVRVALNKTILELFCESFAQNHEIERIIHHAKNANEYDMVVKYAPIAAKQAASVGAHIEASKLYLSAIEYYQGNDKDILVQFYEFYSYECYLTNQIKEAIIYQGKLLSIWQEKNDPEKTGNCMRFLSRLWWFAGNHKQAEMYADQSIEVLNDQPASKAKAMAFSNISQLKMLADLPDECISWGEKAIAMSKELGDQETLSHALNNVGAVQMCLPASGQKGKELLQQSLTIALENSYHEHAARAYTNLGAVSVDIKEYDAASKTLDEGIRYCEERDLDSWTSYMLSWKARLSFETGHWKEACRIADDIIKNEIITSVVKIGALAVMARIKMRRGDPDVFPILIEAKEKAFGTMELQRIIPVLVALLEYEWISGKAVIEKDALDLAIGMTEKMDSALKKSEFAFWLLKVRQLRIMESGVYEGYQVTSKAMAARAAVLWERLGCPYEQALALAEGSNDDKKEAITIIQKLGAEAVFEKMKSEMRSSGIKSIPRGIRRSTLANPAQLTARELDVLQLLKEGMQNKEIAGRLFISVKTVDHHITSILFKLDVNSRVKAVQEAARLEIVK